MKSTVFVEKLKEIATKYKTLYVMGCIGAPLNAKNKARYTTNHKYNKQPARTAMINAASADTFGFDCVCLLKSVLWGWNGNKNKNYGGAVYESNGVPDEDATVMFNRCSDISTDFSKIAVGEAVWKPGHIGVYIGDGLAVECTPSWDNKVQITACNCKKSGYHTRTWQKHGKLPYVEYEKEKPVKKKSITAIANEVIEGKWYTGAARKSALTKAGYDADAVQAKVNEILKKKKYDKVAQEVIDGKWGNGTARKQALAKAGYTAVEITAIQKRVNELL